VDYPVILGHEFSGVVEEVGDGVDAWSPGDRVTCETSAKICGRCVYCRTGRYHMCPDRKGFGALINGAMAEYISVREGILHRVPDGLSFEEAALTEPAAVMFNAMVVNARTVPGDIVVVIGPGPIGMMALQCARLCSPSATILCGQRRDESRMALAGAFGADHLVYTDEEDAGKLLAGLGDSLGAHTIVDAVGLSVTQKQAYAWARPGATVIKVGWDSRPLGESLDPLVAGNLTLQGTFSHTWPTWERLLALAEVGKIDLKTLGTPVPLESWEDGFRGMRNLEIIKSVITF
jgi:alcohol dehydrogenase/L-iditol 2-dehydrogenase